MRFDDILRERGADIPRNPIGTWTWSHAAPSAVPPIASGGARFFVISARRWLLCEPVRWGWSTARGAEAQAFHAMMVLATAKARRPPLPHPLGTPPPSPYEQALLQLALAAHRRHRDLALETAHFLVHAPHHLELAALAECAAGYFSFGDDALASLLNDGLDF